jgi:hypothetical protein
VCVKKKLPRLKKQRLMAHTKKVKKKRKEKHGKKLPLTGNHDPIHRLENPVCNQRLTKNSQKSVPHYM